MKNLLISTASIALLLSPTAFAQDTTSAEASAENLNKTQLEATTNTKSYVYKKANQWSAKELLGEGVRGAEGDRIARIDDLVIGSDDKISDVVMLSGGFFGLGGNRAAIDFNSVGITNDSDYEPVVSVSLTEDAVQSVAEYETDELNDYRLASELIGASVSFQGTDDETVISDLILSSDGTVEHAILADGMIGQWTGDRKAVEFSKISIAQGDGGVVADLTRSEFEGMSDYRYERDDDMYEDSDEMDSMSYEDEDYDADDQVEEEWNETEAEAEQEWDETTREADRAWEKTKEETGEAWDNTKEETGEAWEKTTDKTDKAWDETKEESSEAMEEAGDELEEAGDEIEQETDEVENDLDR